MENVTLEYFSVFLYDVKFETLRISIHRQWPCLARRFIDICADYAVKRRSLQTLPSCQYATFFFGHLPLVNGVGSVTVDNLTAGAASEHTALALRP